MQIKTPDGKDFHKGDDVAITGIGLGDVASGVYTPLGVRYWYTISSPDGSADKNGTWDFIDHKTIHVSGTGDNRLNLDTIIIEPNLQEKNNQILVQVKTHQLDRFVTEDEKNEAGEITRGAGLLGQKGKVDGEYTYFTFAGSDETVNGRIYAITANLKDSEHYVCAWWDPVAQRNYIGNILYFQAGNDPARNILWVRPVDLRYTVSLEGDLRYSTYNIRQGTQCRIGIKSIPLWPK